MSLVPDNEHNVGRNAVGSLVAFLLERDARAGLPAALHRDCQDLLSERRGVRVVVHDPPGNFHFLNTSMVDLFEREHQVTFNGRVLLLSATAS